MAMIQFSAHRPLLVATAVLALTLMGAGLAGTTGPGPRVVADQCTGSETNDDYSLSCAPNVLPGFNDQLTEAEVAMPGFNNGGGVSHGGGHH